MTQGARKTGGKNPEEREFALGDVIGFLRSNALFIGLLTLLIAAAITAVALLIPQQYSKQVTLDPAAVPTSLLGELGQPPVFDDAQLGNLAVEYLRNASIEGVNVSPIYDSATRQVNVALQSGSPEAISAATTALVRTLEESFGQAYERPLDDVIDAREESLRDAIEVNRAATGSLEDEAGAVTGSDPRSLARLEGIESARGGALTEIARSEAEIRELERTREELPRLAEEAVAIQVLSQSEAPQSRSIVPIIALALMLGLVLAVVAALARTVLKRAG